MPNHKNVVNNKKLDIFQEGEPQSLDDILENKDRRVEMHRNMLNCSDTTCRSLCSVSMNIPGEIKNNRMIKEIFFNGIDQLEMKIEQQFGKKVILRKIIWNKDTGMESFSLIDIPAEELKKVTMDFEDYFWCGRLFDIDVLFIHLNKIQSIGREELGVAPRKCFICSDSAKACGRSRRHSLEELREYVNKLYGEFKVMKGC